MSEAMPGVPVMEFVPKPPRFASVVVVWRRAAGGVETFWLKREAKLRFAGGFYAFPGGRLDDADAKIPVEGASGQPAALIVCAARELFEETGLFVPNPEATGLDQHRRALLDGKTSFAGVLSALGGKMRAEDFPEAGRWITPPFMPGRFDTYFYLVEAPPKQHAEVWPGELSEGEWIRPADALTRWEDGTALLHPPSHYALQTLEAFDEAEAVRKRFLSPPHVTDFVATRLEFQRGVKVVPLKTATLPPATHTNAYVLGTHELLLVDPGTDDSAELDVLVSLVQQLIADGHKPKAIVATHHHSDHIGGLARAAEVLGLPVWAHARTADRLPVKTARLLTEGDVLELAGPRPMRWRVLHTPGHAQGHVCLYDEASKAAVVGDMVAGVGTIVIDPPEGVMADYLAQLERLKALPVTTLYPSHGPVIADGPGKLDEYLMHRRWREQKVLESLTALGTSTVERLVEKAYDDVQAFVWPIAERNTVAILEKLLGEGKVRRSGEAFSASASPGPGTA
jgi:glyoxylase-like metal-dependent hydrolase (beta-lactamase superfamily II)/8-oxo-dGTP pyrophosphatase MutT (NUDIX family)